MMTRKNSDKLPVERRRLNSREFSYDFRSLNNYGHLSFCKLSYRTFKRLNFCESSDFGPLTRLSCLYDARRQAATLSPGRGF